jgi:Membrane domain of glycerophosphoryl diester phosphodiesterase
MAEPALRPLSLGEILDRTFSLYRRHFVLFVGITAIPHLLILGMNLWQTIFMKVPQLTIKGPLGTEIHRPAGPTGIMALGLAWGIVALVVYLIAYLFSQGGTIYAVSELYLGRAATVESSLRRVWGQLASLFGVIILNGLAVGVAFIFLIIPGIYLACRLITCVPAALLEDLGARESLERSLFLTKDNAGRAFLIYLLYFVLTYAAALLIVGPLGLAIAMHGKDPNTLRILTALVQVATFLMGIVIGPILLIATSVFYYDLRVRKEAFDLQLMMNPSGNIAGPSRLPSIIS